MIAIAAVLITLTPTAASASVTVGLARLPTQRTVNAAAVSRIRHIFASLNDRVATCYGQGLAPFGEDRFGVRVDIDVRGRVVSSVVIDPSRHGDRRLATCILPRLRHARFPALLGPLSINHVWRFEFRHRTFSFH